MEAKRAVIVARVSTVEQVGEGRFSIPEQLRIGAGVAATEQWEVVGEYVEAGVSGAKPIAERNEIRRLIADAQAGRFDIAIWSKLDRLSRKTQTGIDLITTLRGLGVRVYIHEPKIDTGGGAFGEFAMQMLLAVAELERSLIQERLASGIIARLKDNPRWWPGRPPRFGLTTNEEGELIEDPEQAPIVRTMFERAAAGESPGAIRDWLNERGVQAPRRGSWNHASIWRILTSDSYVTGIIPFSQKFGTGADVVTLNFSIEAPQLVPEDVWVKAQAHLDKRRDDSGAAGRRYDTQYALSGAAFHLEDGIEVPLWGRPRKVYQRQNVDGRMLVAKDADGNSIVVDTIRELYCSARVDGVCTGMQASGPKRTAVGADFLEATTLLRIIPLLRERGTYRNVLAQAAPDLHEDDARALLESKLEDLTEKRRRALEAFLENLIDRPEHDRRIAALDQSLAETKQSLAQLGGVGPEPEDVVQAIRTTLARELDPVQSVNVGRYLRHAGLDEDELGDLLDSDTFDKVLDMVTSDAQDTLAGRSRISPLASMVLNRLVEMLGVRVVIGDDFENPEISLGGVVVGVRDVAVVKDCR